MFVHYLHTAVITAGEDETGGGGREGNPHRLIPQSDVFTCTQGGITGSDRCLGVHKVEWNKIKKSSPNFCNLSCVYEFVRVQKDAKCRCWQKTKKFSRSVLLLLINDMISKLNVGAGSSRHGARDLVLIVSSQVAPIGSVTLNRT